MRVLDCSHQAIPHHGRRSDDTPMNHLPRSRLALAVLLLAGGLRTAVAAEEGSDASPPLSAAEQPVLPGHILGGDGPGTELYRHITAEELVRILGRHRQWLATSGREGQRADLTGVRLDDANLDGADLRYAVMNWACLCRAHLRNANLSWAALGCADFRGAQMDGVNLRGALLCRSYFKGADLHQAQLQGARLGLGGDPTAAGLLRIGREFGQSLPKWTDFGGANLTEANLDGAELTGANLTDTSLKDASLDHAVVSGAYFQLRRDSLPNLRTFGLDAGLFGLTYTDDPGALLELRNAFREAGMTEAAYEVNFAKRHTQRLHSHSFPETVGLLAVEWPCAYGLKPGRPLIVLVVAILVFFVPYYFALRDSGRPAGIWKTWPDDHRPKSRAEEPDVRLTARGPKRWGWALYFSLVSAFNIGWEELNVSTWIERMQPEEFELKATGWVRVVAGAQSLLGVYMVALAIMSYFGHFLE
jgi:uncharacterized protein YjbI with pentapeptide repeats